MNSVAKENFTLRLRHILHEHEFLKTEVCKLQKSVSKLNEKGVYCSEEFGIWQLVSFLVTDYYYCIDQATFLHF